MSFELISLPSGTKLKTLNLKTNLKTNKLKNSKQYEDRKHKQVQLEPSSQSARCRAHRPCRGTGPERLREMVAMGSAGRTAPR